MILYPFQPGFPLGYSITGYDEARNAPAEELFVLSAGMQPPAQFTGGFLFCEAPAFCDSRLLQPAQCAPAQASAVWVDTQISGGNLEEYLHSLLCVWAERLWVWLSPMCMCFPIPCPSGLGTPVSAQTAAQLCLQHRSYDSADFLCRYSVFLDEQQTPRVFLFDTDETCRKKLALLRALGVRRVFGAIPI